MFNSESLLKKWSPIINHDNMPKLDNNYKKSVLSVILENQQIAMREETAIGNYMITEAAPSNNTGNVANWEPVMISMLRRTMPNLIAYDIASVQPMNGPVDLIFAQYPKYQTSNSPDITAEAFYGEANTGFTGSGTHGGNSSSLPTDIGLVDTSSPYNTVMPTDDDGGGSTSNDVSDAFGVGTGMTTAIGEKLGDSLGNPFPEMSFTIAKSTVTAMTRALKAEYTVELAQDFKKIHGGDAESELANILSAQLLAEINRELIRTINVKAMLGAQQAGLAFKDSPPTGTGNNGRGGVFDMILDTDGRWQMEKYRGLAVHIEREANEIARQTRMGKGNFILCSSDVASVLASAGILDYSPQWSSNLEVDDTGNTFAGVINGRLRVYVDPYATGIDYVTVGYRGTNIYDAGMFYCPYVPLTMMRAMDPNSFQPKIGFKTRYGMIANPFAELNGVVSGTGNNRSNRYYRIFAVRNLRS